MKVSKILDLYKKRLGLEDYLIELITCDDEHIYSDKNNKLIKKESDYVAEVNNRNYDCKEFSIVINRKHLKTEIKDTILHECLHILLWSFSDMVESLINISNLDESGKSKLTQELSIREHDLIERLIPYLK